jgi:Flp pilus assembly pilin Flp
MRRHILKKAQGFWADRSGAAMVEFAISLPFLLLIIAIVIEGSRIAWTHQAAASGVRDAVRYIARIAPVDICGGTANILDYEDDATSIVALRLPVEEDGNPIPFEQILPGGVRVVNVTTSLQCIKGDYRIEEIGIVEVRAEIEIEFPFGGIFDLFGDPLEPLTTEIADESRVFGT